MCLTDSFFDGFFCKWQFGVLLCFELGEVKKRHPVFCSSAVMNGFFIFSSNKTPKESYHLRKDF